MADGRPQGPRGLVNIATRIAPASLLVQALSFGSSIALATQLGATTQTDAYYLALSVPAIAYGVLVGAMRLGAIPALSEVNSRGSPAEFGRACDEVVSATLAAATAASIAATAVMLVVLPLATGGSAHLQSLTRLFVAELSPYTVTGAMLGVLGAILAVRQRFVVATVVLTFEPVLKSALVIAFGRHLGAQALVIGNLVGNALAVAVLWALVVREGVVLHLTRFRRSPVLRKVMVISGPLLISQILLTANPLVDRATAAALGAGSVTVFELGVRLFNVPTSLVTGVFIAPLAATWSARFLQQGWEAIAESFGRIVTAIVLILPPLIAIGFVMRHQLVAVIYLSHRYSASDVRRTANVLGMLMLGLTPQVLVAPLATLFIVRGDAVFPMKVGIANFVLNAALDLALRGPFGVAGIAFSTALTLTILCAVFVREARRRWGRLNLRASFKPTLVSLASCAVIALLTELLLRVAGTISSRWETLAVLTGIAVVALVVHCCILVLARAPIAAALPMTRGWSLLSLRALVLRGR